MKRRHPPFVASAGHSGADYCTHAGAQKLAELIRAAWADAGVRVVTEVVPVQARSEGNIWGVRLPSLTNGLPIEAQS